VRNLNGMNPLARLVRPAAALADFGLGVLLALLLVAEDYEFARTHPDLAGRLRGRAGRRDGRGAAPPEPPGRRAGRGRGLRAGRPGPAAVAAAGRAT
jgi:hypothetical protein